MTLIHYNPIRPSREPETGRPFSDVINNIFNDTGFNSRYDVFQPAVDISEGKDRYHVAVSLPGLKKDDINIDLKNGTLIISGEKKRESDNGHRKYHLVESGYGRFSRTFKLNKDVDQDNIKARFTDGILKIDLGKKSKSLHKKVEIK